MTFTIKLRGAPGPIAAEYVCPEHDRFTLIVSRDEQGDPPADAPCPECGAASFWAPSAPMVKAFWKPRALVKGSGKADEQPTPYHQDLTRVADGKETLGEWKEKRENLWRDWRNDKIKKAVS